MGTVDPWNCGRKKVTPSHNDQSYKVQVTKMGWLITKNSKHIKPTPITAEQYPRFRLSRGRETDTLEDIIKDFERQTQKDKCYTHKQILKASRSDTS